MSALSSPLHSSLSSVRRASDQLGSLPHRSVDPYTFQRSGGCHPRMLFQLFAIQSLVRKGIVGEDFWDEQSIRRAQLNPGLHVSVHSLLGYSRKGKCRSSARVYASQTSITTTAAQQRSVLHSGPDPHLTSPLSCPPSPSMCLRLG
jgi:hypothetical protein